jgi:hypothetical protein
MLSTGQLPPADALVDGVPGLDQGHPLRNLGICRAVPPSRLARGRRLVYVYAVARRCFIAMKVNKSLASNEDWKAWGKLDLLYGVATIRERAKHGANPWTNSWTDESFYEVVAIDWRR